MASRAYQGIRICRGAPTIHHLLFADDSFLFSHASPVACSQIQSILQTYAIASGQQVNLAKSSICFSQNLAFDTQQQLAGLLGVVLVFHHEKYLGLPTYVGKAKTKTFTYLKDKLRKRLSGWKGKLLSVAGKELLIKVVAQALPTYAMSCFLLPSSLCYDLQQLCANFFWGDSDGNRKIHWKSWKAMCTAKDDGGLGFRHLYAFNLAMLAKQAWRVVQNPSSLVGQIYRACYFPRSSFWDASLGSSPSYSWRSILTSREVLVLGSRWQVGNGTDIAIWEDRWIPRPHGFRPFLPIRSPTIFRFVSQLFRPGLSEWDVELLSTLFLPEDVQLIISIPLS